MTGDAVMSDDGLYRYALTRSWEPADAEAPASVIAFVMLNPSTADADADDATVRRCRAFAHGWSYTGLLVVNLFAWRARHPEELIRTPDAVGPDNPRYLDSMLSSASVETVVAAWGAMPIAVAHGNAFRRRAAQLGRPLYTLGLTRDGHPRHPLYLPRTTALELWP